MKLGRLKLSIIEFGEIRVAHHEEDGFNLALFWEERAKATPELYQLSQVFMGIPHSTMRVERDFHALALTLTCLRTRLSDEMLDAIILLKQNFWMLKEAIADEDNEKLRKDFLAPLRVKTKPKKRARED